MFLLHLVECWNWANTHDSGIHSGRSHCHDAVMDVAVTNDADRVLTEASAFLYSKPAEHNLILTLLSERAAHPAQPTRPQEAIDVSHR